MERDSITTSPVELPINTRPSSVRCRACNRHTKTIAEDVAARNSIVYDSGTDTFLCLSLRNETDRIVRCRECHIQPVHVKEYHKISDDYNARLLYAIEESKTYDCKTNTFCCPPCSVIKLKTQDEESMRRQAWDRLVHQAAEKNYKSGWAAHEYKTKFGQWPPSEWSAQATKVVQEKTENKQKKEPMNKNVSKVLESAKFDAKAGAELALARQLARAVRAPLIVLATQHLDANREKVEKFLDSVTGLATLKILCGLLLGLSPLANYEHTNKHGDPLNEGRNKAALIAQYLRVDGIADLGDAVLGLFALPLFGELKDVLTRIRESSSVDEAKS